MTQLILAAVVSSIAFAASANTIRPSVIYGQDNRVEVFQVPEAIVREVADSTVALIPTSKLTSDGRGGVQIRTSHYGRDYGLCANEPFYDQPTAANCSGFLVGPDLIATAGHCVRSQSACEGVGFVFGFKMNDETTPASSVSSTEVYNCKRLVSQELTRNQDYALIQLDRPVTNHRPLALAQQNANQNDPIIVIGHPAGLPTKVAGGAAVRRLETGFYVANLDTYGGNSGSAVFNANTMEVNGILVRGERDFRYDSAGSCSRSNICTDLDCRGEDVTFISYIVKAVTSHNELSQ